MLRSRLRALAALAVVVTPVALYAVHMRTTHTDTARAATSGSPPPALRFVAPDGSDHGSCSSARPCATLGAAYLSAAPGRTIVTIAAGHYPIQTIDADPTMDGRRTGVVSYRPDTPGTVDLDELIVDAPDVQVADLRTAGWTILPGGSRVTFRNIESTAAIFVNGAQNVRILGGSVSSVGRPMVNGSEVKAVEGSSTPPRNVLFDGVSFHDMLRAPGSSNHVDCLHVMAVDGLIVRRSRFWNCEAFDILFTEFGDAGSPRNVILENNFFQCCHSGYYAVALGGGHGEHWSHFELRNNTSDSSLSVDPASTVSGPIRIIGNLATGLSGSCRDGVTVDWNVWTNDTRCGPHDRVGGAGFTPGGDAEFHLIGCPPAVGRADPDDVPALDIDGDRRPSGRRPDAGADEAVGCTR
jgi:hypothetical protein